MKGYNWNMLSNTNKFLIYCSLNVENKGPAVTANTPALGGKSDGKPLLLPALCQHLHRDYFPHNVLVVAKLQENNSSYTPKYTRITT